MMKNGFIATLCATFAMTVQADCTDTDTAVVTPFVFGGNSLCSFYNKHQQYCDLHAEILAAFGFNPLKMCCGCGGGEKESESESESDYDSDDVCNLVSSASLPKGYKVMSMKDVKKNAKKCRRALGRWGIANLSDGKADGWGYRNNLTEGNHFGCDYIGQMLVMAGRGKKIEYPDSCPDGEVVGNFRK